MMVYLIGVLRILKLLYLRNKLLNCQNMIVLKELAIILLTSKYKWKWRFKRVLSLVDFLIIR